MADHIFSRSEWHASYEAQDRDLSVGIWDDGEIILESAHEDAEAEFIHPTLEEWREMRAIIDRNISRMEK